MDAHVLAITTTTTTEEAVEIFDKYDRSALPIITENGVLVGIVTFDDILDKVQEQTTEEIHKFGDSVCLKVVKTRSRYRFCSLCGNLGRCNRYNHLLFYRGLLFGRKTIID